MDTSFLNMNGEYFQVPVTFENNSIGGIPQMSELKVAAPYVNQENLVFAENVPFQKVVPGIGEAKCQFFYSKPENIGHCGSGVKQIQNKREYQREHSYAKHEKLGSNLPVNTLNNPITESNYLMPQNSSSGVYTISGSCVAPTVFLASPAQPTYNIETPYYSIPSTSTYTKDPVKPLKQDSSIQCTLLDPARLRKRTVDLERKIHSLRYRETKAKKAYETLSASLNGLFNYDEFLFLHGGNLKGEHWSEETVQKAKKIYSVCGPKGYGFLRELGYPLPSEQVFLRSESCAEGLLEGKIDQSSLLEQ